MFKQSLRVSKYQIVHSGLKNPYLFTSSFSMRSLLGGNSGRICERVYHKEQLKVLVFSKSFIAMSLLAVAGTLWLSAANLHPLSVKAVDGNLPGPPTGFLLNEKSQK